MVVFLMGWEVREQDRDVICDFSRSLRLLCGE